MDKTATVRATANTSGALWIDGLQVQFREGQPVNWPSADASRAEAAGAITIIREQSKK